MGNLRFKIDWASLATGRKLTVFALFTLYLRAFNKGFFALRVWGAYISRGLHMEGLTFGILRYVNLNRKQYLINLFLLLCSTKKITDKLLSKAWR